MTGSTKAGPGKRERRLLGSAVGRHPTVSSVSNSSSGLMSITDRLSRRTYLVDSGADECIYPASAADQFQAQTTDLIAANGSSIKTFGKWSLKISFAPGHEVQHRFWIANVMRPILGANFFATNGLVIDLQRCPLVSNTGASFRASSSPPPKIFGLRLPTAGP